MSILRTLRNDNSGGPRGLKKRNFSKHFFQRAPEILCVQSSGLPIQAKKKIYHFFFSFLRKIQQKRRTSVGYHSLGVWISVRVKSGERDEVSQQYNTKRGHDRKKSTLANHRYLKGPQFFFLSLLLPFQTNSSYF